MFDTACDFFLFEAQSAFVGAYAVPVPAETGGDRAGPGCTRLML